MTRNDLPTDRLAAYLERQLDGFRGPLTATRFTGGQSNPTYRLDAVSGCYVLRLRPSGPLLASAHAIDREFRVIGALVGSGVPVARPLLLCDDTSVIGSMFYLMSHVDGRIFRDPALPELDRDERAAYYDEIIRVLAAIHRVDVDRAGLSGHGRAGNYFARQIARWTEQYRASATASTDAMEMLIATLPTRCPADGGHALVHGDFRIDNLIFDRDRPQVLAVLDWELSTLGDPLADLGYFCMALRLPRNPVIPGLGGLDRATLGIPTEDELLRRYATAAGKAAVPDWPFVLAFSYFRLAAIAQGVARRAIQGNASSAQAAEAGQMVQLLAVQGAALLDRAQFGGAIPAADTTTPSH